MTLLSCSRSVAEANSGAVEGIPVRAALALRQDVPLEVSAVGNVEALHTVEVKSRIAGQIRRVAFEEGQDVTKGQLLFTIDLDVLQRQAAEQQAETERDAAMEQQARAVLERDTASQRQSQSEADNALELAKEGIFSKERADQLRTANETARAVLRSDQAAVNAAAGTIKACRARLAQTQLQLGFTDVLAPIAGRTGAVMVRAGNIVRDSDAILVTLRQLAPIDVTFGVPEQILPELQRLNAEGCLAVEAHNGDGTKFEGRLVFIDNTVDATTGTIRLKAEFPNTNRALWPGQFVDVRLRLQTEYGRLTVPEASIQDGQEGKYVWLIKSNIATTAPVTVLRTYKPENGPELAILAAGIKAGDRVVTEGQLRLTPGAKVVVNRSRLSPGQGS
jgi:multidrug efflux system membrane fusion protein